MTDITKFSAKRLKEFWSEYSLSTSEVAGVIGASGRQVKEWEIGKSHPNQKYSRRLNQYNIFLNAQKTGSVDARDLRKFYPIDGSDFTGIDIKLWRQLQETTQVEFAGLIGVSTATVQNWEGARFRKKQIRRDLVERLNWVLLNSLERVDLVTNLFGFAELEYFNGNDALRLRQALWLTQAEFAQFLKISVATIREWESPMNEESRLNMNRQKVLKNFIKALKRVPIPQDETISDPKWFFLQASMATSQQENLGTPSERISRDPRESVTSYAIQSIEAWLANIRRIGEIQQADISKLQADLEYIRTFIDRK